jgi:redox-sensitive bicupin YhaK (pirin superfamily)
MKRVLHKADARGVGETDWLYSRHTFSFGEYYDDNRMGFGALRVVNDDLVQPGMGFDTHSHRNMEIVSIPLSGSLRHEDSEGHTQLIERGEVQIMSAGTGISHSEYNGSDSEPVKFLQIWVLPKERNIQPRYDQKSFTAGERLNRFQTVVSPDTGDDAVWINQDAWFLLGDFDAGGTTTYRVRRAGNGVYFFIIEGSLKIAGKQLSQRDGLGVRDTEDIAFEVTESCRILIMDVPME